MQHQKSLLQHSKHIYCNIRRESAATMRKSYYNISSTTNAILEKALVATKIYTATSRENLPQQRKKQNETSQELLCNIRETHVATTKKDTVTTFHIICCNIENKSLQNNAEI